MDRRPWRRDIFLEPYNGHLSAVPIAIHKLLFVTVGIDSVALHRLTLLGLHLVCVALLFVYARRRVGDWLAVLVAASLLFLGSGWHDLPRPVPDRLPRLDCSRARALLLQDRRAWGQTSASRCSSHCRWEAPASAFRSPPVCWQRRL